MPQCGLTGRKYWYVDGIKKGFINLATAQIAAEKRYGTIRWERNYRNYNEGHEVLIGKTDDDRSVVLWWESR